MVKWLREDSPKEFRQIKNCQTSKVETLKVNKHTWKEIKNTFIVWTRRYENESTVIKDRNKKIDTINIHLNNVTRCQTDTVKILERNKQSKLAYQWDWMEVTISKKGPREKERTMQKKEKIEWQAQKGTHTHRKRDIDQTNLRNDLDRQETKEETV